MAEKRPGSFHVDASFHGWPYRPRIEAANTMYFIAMAGLIVVGIGLAMLKSAFPWLTAPRLTILSTLIVELGLVLTPSARYCLLHEGAAGCMRIRMPKASSIALATLSAVVMVMLTAQLSTLWMLLIEALGGALSESPLSELDSPTLKLVMICLLPAICEELLFRGMILSAWERRGTLTALVVSSLLFASMHGTVIGLPSHILTGFVLGFIAISSNSIVASMVFHAVYNGFMIFMSDQSSGAIAMGEPLLDYLGGLPALLWLIVNSAIFGAILVALMLMIRAAGGQKGQPKWRTPMSKEPMGTAALVVLIVGIATAALLYLLDFLEIAGVF